MTNAWQGLTPNRNRIQWVLDNPDFRFMPATIVEFLGPGYLDMDHDQNPYLDPRVVVRPGLKKALSEIFGTTINPERFSTVRRSMFSGSIGCGKGHTPDTPLLTPTGWRALADLGVGDQVIGSNGLPTEITGYFPRGTLPAYRVTFNDGASVVVDGDHLWNVKTPSTKMRHNAPWSTMSTRDLIEVGVTDSRGQKRFHIPIVEPVEFDATATLLIKPYLLGALLGDGGLTNSTPVITSADPEILERVAEEATGLEPKLESRYDYMLVSGRPGGRDVSGRNWLTNALRYYGLMYHHSHDKFIPTEYLTASVDDRVDLLRGIMDTDGWMQDGKHARFASSSSTLADGVEELVRSLGGVCKRTVKKTVGRDSHVLAINIAVNPFHLKRKADLWKPFEKYAPARMISSIEPVGEKEIICISVKADDQLYVTKDYIVTHNTTYASIAMAYVVHWVSCLKDPQQFFGLQPGSRIAFMLMSTKGSQASEVLFSDIKARVANCEWFKKYAPMNQDSKIRRNQLRFPKDIWIIPGNSQETTFEGYNILFGILDEGDSHKVTEEKDYALEGFNTIENRITSRFSDLAGAEGDHKGLIMVIGQMKKSNGFMAKKKKEFLAEIAQAERSNTKATCHYIAMSIWESHGWEKYRNKTTGEIPVFHYDVSRRKIIPPGPANFLGASPNVMKIPQVYKRQFERDPVKALRDLAGIPPNVEDPFISMTDRIEGCFDRFKLNHPNMHAPVSSSPHNPQFHLDFGPDPNGNGLLKRVIHVDIGYASHGDAGALAMGHVKEVVDIDGELKPYIVFDMIMRFLPRGGEDLMLKTFRDVVVKLRDEYRYKIGVVSYDGFQSVESQQILRRQHRFNVAETSVDRSKGPYEDLREAINEQRVEFPEYMTLLRRNDTEKTSVVRKELLELQDTGRKIDHPPQGSKDIADCLAAVTHILMSNQTYSRGARRGQIATTPEAEADWTGFAVEQERQTSHQPFTLERNSAETDIERLLGSTAAPNGLPSPDRDPFGAWKPRMR